MVVFWSNCIFAFEKGIQKYSMMDCIVESPDQADQAFMATMVSILEAYKSSGGDTDNTVENKLFHLCRFVNKLVDILFYLNCYIF